MGFTFNLKPILDEINIVTKNSNRGNYLQNINSDTKINDQFVLYQKLSNTEIIRAIQGKYYLTFTFYGTGDTSKVYLVTQLDNFQGPSEQQVFMPFHRNRVFDEFLLRTPVSNIKGPENSDYLCFGTQPGIDNQADCKAVNGIWDHPVSSSTECPFNAQGYGATNGYCSVPPEYALVGFRNYILKSDESNVSNGK